jgi:hypothetical protein
MLALSIGKVQSFDPSQSQELLRSLTAGLGVALLTTMVGLVGNVLLGLQLTRLDRFADALVADIQRAALEPLVQGEPWPVPRGDGDACGVEPQAHRQGGPARERPSAQPARREPR